MLPVYITSDKKWLNDGTIVQLQWTNDHEEADAKMFVLVNHIVDKLWLKTGDKKRYVAIHKTANHFEKFNAQIFNSFARYNWVWLR